MNPLLMGSLDLGVGLLSGLSSSRRAAPTAPQAAVFGFTAPTDIYEAMRQIETSAAALDPDIVTNVSDPAFRRAWAAWLLEWRRFFNDNYRTVKTLLHTDELKLQVETYRLQLLSWYEGYVRQTTTAGQPVPAPRGVPPFKPPPESEKASGSFLPWWAWVLGGVALVGVGYLGYRKYHELSAKRRAIETEVLPGLIGAPLARAAAARDPGEEGSRDYILTNYDRDQHLPSWYRDGRR